MSRTLAVGPTKPKVKWVSESDGSPGVHTSPVVGAGEVIYVGDGFGRLRALSAAGVELWSYQAGRPISGAAAIGASGTVYVGTRKGDVSEKVSGSVEAVDAQTGTKRWSFESMESGILGSVVLGPDESIYAGFSDEGFPTSSGTLVALAPDGTVRWKLAGGGIAGSPAVGHDGNVYVVRAGGSVQRVAPTGVPTEVSNAGKDMLGATATIGASGRMFFRANVAGQELWALDPSGELAWNVTVSDAVMPAPHPTLGFDGTVYYLGEISVDLSATSADGAPLWKKPLGAVPSFSPVIDGAGNLFVSAVFLHVLDPLGNPLAEYLEAPPGFFYITAPAIGGDGTLYVGAARSNDPTQGAIIALGQ